MASFSSPSRLVLKQSGSVVFNNIIQNRKALTTDKSESVTLKTITFNNTNSTQVGFKKYVPKHTNLKVLSSNNGMSNDNSIFEKRMVYYPKKLHFHPWDTMAKKRVSHLHSKPYSLYSNSFYMPYEAKKSRMEQKLALRNLFSNR